MFTKGNQLAKGNGRPKGSLDKSRKQLQEVILNLITQEELIGGVIEVFRKPDNQGVKMEAATWLADRAYGKPTQQLSIDPQNDTKIIIEIEKEHKERLDKERNNKVDKM